MFKAPSRPRSALFTKGDHSVSEVNVTLVKSNDAHREASGGKDTSLPARSPPFLINTRGHLSAVFLVCAHVFRYKVSSDVSSMMTLPPFLPLCPGPLLSCQPELKTLVLTVGSGGPWTAELSTTLLLNLLSCFRQQLALPFPLWISLSLLQ